MPISGTQGYVLNAGVAIPADKWDADLNQATPDRSNFMTQGEPLNAAGQRTGSVTLQGPYEALIGFERGALATVGLGITADIAIVVVIRISNYKFSNDKDGGPRWQITGQQYGAATVAGVAALTGL